MTLEASCSLRVLSYRRAKDEARLRREPIAVIVADAAAETLLPPVEESAATKVDNLAKRLLSRLETLERALGREQFITKEMLAQFVRAYLNHTPAIPDSERAAASMSGRLRFVRLLEQVKLNARQSVSIFDDSETTDAR